MENKVEQPAPASMAELVKRYESVFGLLEPELVLAGIRLNDHTVGLHECVLRIGQTCNRLFTTYADRVSDDDQVVETNRYALQVAALFHQSWSNLSKENWELLPYQFLPEVFAKTFGDNDAQGYENIAEAAGLWCTQVNGAGDHGFYDICSEILFTAVKEPITPVELQELLSDKEYDHDKFSAYLKELNLKAPEIYYEVWGFRLAALESIFATELQSRVL